MKKLFYISVVVIFSAMWSCDSSVGYMDPKYLDGSILDGTAEIDQNIRDNFEGVYKVTKGADFFGSQVVLKWRDDKAAIFGNKQGIYFIMDAGEKDSIFLFEGKWKKMQTLETGLVRLKIDKAGGARHIWNNTAADQSVILKGAYGFGDNPNQEEVEFHYLRPFSDEVKNSRFLILAHRGGGRNSEYLGASENTLEIIAKAEQFGANGIEIDIKLTKDNVPILYHDVNINLRLTQESPILGPVEDFTFPQLRTFVRLRNGERIPSLKETLEFVLTQTTLRFVWLDMKSSRNSMPYVIPIQQDINRRARESGRDLTVYIGLPSQEMREYFMAYPDYENIESINEGSVDEVRESNSHVWAPRWTEGMQTGLVREMHNEGRIAITWTLDQTEFISKYINESEFDGLITNFPTIAAYYHYAK